MYLGHDPESSSNLIPEKFHTPQGLNVLKINRMAGDFITPSPHLWSNRDTIKQLSVAYIALVLLIWGREGVVII